MIPHQQQQTTPPPPPPTPTLPQQPPPPPPPCGSTGHRSPPMVSGGGDQNPNLASASVEPMIARVRFSDIDPYEGASSGVYTRAVETLCCSLVRHNAAVIELPHHDSAIIRCGLEATRSFFRTTKSPIRQLPPPRSVYIYRAGRYVI